MLEVARTATRRSFLTAGSAALIVPTPGLATPSAAEPAQAVLLASSEVSWTADRLLGPGAERLLQAASQAQFLIIVESHNDHVTPKLTAELFRRLHDSADYDYVAIEQDPWGMERVSSPDVRGNLALIAELARRHPYSFTFSTDEELQLLAAAGRTSDASEPIWGVDQLFGAAGPLGELSRLHAGASNTELGELLAAAERMEMQRGADGLRDPSRHHFLSAEANRLLGQLNGIRSLPFDTAEPRARELIDRLEQSARIYAANARARDLDEGGVPYGLKSNQWREELMKASFMAKYRRARAESSSLPRVVVKAGYWHAVRGRGPGNVFTLGGFLHELASAEGTQAVTVQVLPLREWWPTYDSVDPEYRVLLRQDAMERSTLVDLRPIRGSLHAGATFGLTGSPLATLRNIAFGLDYLLFMPSRAGSYDLTASI